MQTERWTQIAEFPEYAVSNTGYVMKLVTGNRYRAGEIVTPVLTQVGYLAINVYPARKLVYIHRLVAETYLGPCPEGSECHHIDGDKHNNNASNLEWVVKKDHLQDNILQTGNRGGNNPMAKLTEANVVEIQHLLQSGFTGKAIASLYGISAAAVSAIKNQKRWTGRPTADKKGDSQ